jgi:hypothetical protein
MLTKAKLADGNSLLKTCFLLRTKTTHIRSTYDEDAINNTSVACAIGPSVNSLPN